MRESESSSKPRSAEPARSADRARKPTVRVNELPDAYPTARGVAAPPEIILEPVAIQVAAPVLAAPEPPPLVFEDMSAPPRMRPRRPRTLSPWVRRALWALATLVATVAFFFVGMAVGERRANRRYEAALSNVEPPALAAVSTKRDSSTVNPKKIADVKPPPTTSKKTEPTKTATPKPTEAPRPGAAVAFDTHVRPILQAKCVVCHGGQAKKGDLDLRTLASLKKGGENGAAVVPGDLNASILWEFVSNNKMPPGKSSKLTADEKKVIQDWIAGGAK